MIGFLSCCDGGSSTQDARTKCSVFSPMSLLAVISLAARTPTRSIRDLDLAVRLTVLVLSDITAHHQETGDEGKPNISELCELAIALVMLRIVQPSAYRLLCRSPGQGALLIEAGTWVM